MLASDAPCFYVLANTRALSTAAAAARAEEIGRNLRAAAARLRGGDGDAPFPFGVVSRGDSTLRGHYPAETDALAKGLGWEAPTTVLAPFFAEARHDRLTIASLSSPLAPE